jgi:hypothetical protein
MIGFLSGKISVTTFIDDMLKLLLIESVTLFFDLIQGIYT